MSSSYNYFFCCECKTHLENLVDLLFIEEDSHKGFCSESCILNHYAPVVENFERSDLEFRVMCELKQTEACSAQKENMDLVGQTLENPDEVWLVTNELGQKYYTQISKYTSADEEFYFILICSYFDGAPSFVFFQTTTYSKKLVSQYRIGEKLGKDIDDEVIESKDGKMRSEEIKLSQDSIEILEQKKSEELARLLENRSDEDDIDYNLFPMYEKFLPQNLEEPDEVYKKIEDDEVTLTFIRSYKEDSLDFFYIVICMEMAIEEIPDNDVLVPVIGFPSTDKDLYLQYAAGEKIQGIIKN